MSDLSFHNDDFNIKTAILHPRRLFVDFSNPMVKREQMMIIFIDQFQLGDDYGTR